MGAACACACACSVDRIFGADRKTDRQNRSLHRNLRAYAQLDPSLAYCEAIGLIAGESISQKLTRRPDLFVFRHTLARNQGCTRSLRISHSMYSIVATTCGLTTGSMHSLSPA